DSRWICVAQLDCLRCSCFKLRTHRRSIWTDNNGAAIHWQPDIATLQRQKVESIFRFHIIQLQWCYRSIDKTPVEYHSNSREARYLFVRAARSLIHIQG